MSKFLSSICRLCGNISDKLLKIYNNDGSSEYTERIHNYLNINLEGGDRCLWIGWCCECRERLEQWDEFVNKVKVVDAFFTSLPDSLDIVVDSDSTQLDNLKESEESLRLTNRKKKRRRKTIAEDEGEGDADDFVVSAGAISSAGASNNKKIRLTIRKIKDDVSEVKLGNETDEDSKEEILLIKHEPAELEETDRAANLVDLELPSSPYGEDIFESQKEETPQSGEGEKNERRDTDFAQFPWECWFCKSVQTSWNALARHCKLEHDSPAKIECLCGQVLLCRSSVVKHHLKHTVGLKYKCDYENCSKTFVRQSLLDAHSMSHLPKDKQPWLCCKCSRRFHSEYLLKQHERMHLPKEEKIVFPCYVCQKNLCSKSAVSAHVRSVHLGERPFVCDQCGLSFTSKGILAEHLMTHSDVFNHHCQDCGKSFKTKYRLRIHMDTHLQTRYACPVCELTLNTRRTLRMHLLVHQDRKNFSCDTCGKGFKRSKDLKNHRNLHTGQRPYLCPFCPRTFANGSNCRSHKRRMHPVELKQLEDGVLGKEVAIVHLDDVMDEEQVILQEDVLMAEPAVDDELELEKGEETEGMTVITNDELTANFVHPFHTSYPCIPPISANLFLYRQ